MLKKVTTNNKTATLTLRIEPKIKDLLRAAATQEHRSIANMVEILILEHCTRLKIKVPSMHNVLIKEACQDNYE